jgi:hypothetical protein
VQDRSLKSGFSLWKTQICDNGLVFKDSTFPALPSSLVNNKKRSAADWRGVEWKRLDHSYKAARLCREFDPL